MQELVSFAAEEGPAHAFYSAAYYKTPDAPQMPLKGWQGADLIFDIDADHLDVPCQREHDWWVCQECNRGGKGRRPETCPQCNATRIQEHKWMCEECLNEAKREVTKIIEEFLVPDFGISKSHLMIVFSGHRGYHIHCYDKSIHPVGSTERREIVDYIIGTGFDPKFHGFAEGTHGASSGPDIRSPGWEHKLAEGIQELFTNPNEIAKVTGLRVSQKQTLKTYAKDILRGLKQEPPRYLSPRGIGKAAWQDLAQYIIKKLSAAVDEPVTTDIHRLIRLPGSLHGKTGFLVKKLDLASFDSFDPFRDAQVFQGIREIFIEESPAFRIGDVEYPPMHEVKKELPLSVAMFLMCKGVAQLIE